MKHNDPMSDIALVGPGGRDKLKKLIKSLQDTAKDTAKEGENVEYVTAQALNDLNSRIEELERQVTPLSNNSLQIFDLGNIEPGVAIELSSEQCSAIYNSVAVLVNGYVLPRNDSLALNNNVKSILIAADFSQCVCFFGTITSSDTEPTSYIETDTVYALVLNDNHYCFIIEM